MNITAAEKIVLIKMQNAGRVLALENMSVREVRTLDRLAVKGVVIRSCGEGRDTYWKLNDNVILLRV